MRRLCVPKTLRVVTFVLLFPVVANAQTRTGHVKGFVWFTPFIKEEKLYGKVLVPGVEISFRSSSFESKLASNQDGEYETDLPEGEYEVTTSFPLGNRDFWELYAAKRAVFAVKPGSNLIFNLMVPIRHNANAVFDGIWGPDYHKKLNQGERLASASSASPTWGRRARVRVNPFIRPFGT